MQPFVVVPTGTPSDPVTDTGSGAALPDTGSAVAPQLVPLGVALAALGAGLVVAGRRRV